MSDQETSTTSSLSNSPTTSTTLAVRVHPRAARDCLAGWRDGRLLVRTTAPPVEGRANDAVCRLIAERAGVAPSRVHVIRGHRAQDKAVRVQGLPRADLLRALEHPDYV